MINFEILICVYYPRTIFFWNTISENQFNAKYLFRKKKKIMFYGYETEWISTEACFNMFKTYYFTQIYPLKHDTSNQSFKIYRRE